MKIKTLSYILLFFINISYGQELKLEKVTQEELLEKRHPKDSTANACYLLTLRKKYVEKA